MFWDEECQRIQLAISQEARGNKFRRYRPTLKELNRRTVVYFIREETSGLIKIGFSKDVDQRLKNLQTSNPNPLTLLAVGIGSTIHESALHKRFSEYHSNGEWFYPGPKLLEYIETIKAKPDQWGRKRRQYIQ